MAPSNIEQGEDEKRNSSVGTDPNSAAIKSPLQVSGPFQPPRLAQFRLSKSSDQQKAAADMAYERLRIEQEERRKTNQAKESTTVEQGAGTLECRNWFERRESQSSSKSESSEEPESKPESKPESQKLGNI